jgi:hypothetical protein
MIISSSPGMWEASLHLSVVVNRPSVPMPIMKTHGGRRERIKGDRQLRSNC